MNEGFSPRGMLSQTLIYFRNDESARNLNYLFSAILQKYD
jgi:hypothetical protein